MRSLLTHRSFFFFQAEDGIRDVAVTGVQTCALPISFYPSPQLSRQDTLEVIFTSGTTAEPRGVVISHGNILANIERLELQIHKYLRYERLVHPLRFLNLLPLSHVFGQMLGVFIPPMLRATVVFTDSLMPADLVDTIRQERVSVLVAVPRFIESLQREVERCEERDGRLETFRRNFAQAEKRSEERRVGKECRSRWSPYH